MDAPPGGTPTDDRNLTDLRPRKRNRRAEADRHRMTRTPLHRRVCASIRRAGVEPQPFQVESVVATMIANHEEPTDEQILRELMRAPWFTKPRVLHHGIGGPGWRVTTA